LPGGDEDLARKIWSGRGTYLTCQFAGFVGGACKKMEETTTTSPLNI